MPKRGDIIKEYRVIKKIGKGGVGEVFLVETISAPVKQYALKIADNVLLNDEIKVGLVLSQKCPYLVKYKETFVEEEDFYIVMEYCEGGDLEKRLMRKTPLNDMEIFRFLYESGIAIKSLHDANIIHRDIKLSNFFLLLTGAFKLGDFGLARRLDSTSAQTMTCVGSEGFTAPEIMEGKRTYTNKADVYSWGVTLLYLILGRSPFANEDGTLNMKLAVNGTPSAAALKHSHQLMPLALRMITADPNARPSTGEVLAFPFSALALLHTALKEAEKERDGKMAEAKAKEKERDEKEKLRKERDVLFEENRNLKKEIVDLKGKIVSIQSSPGSKKASAEQTAVPPPKDGNRTAVLLIKSARINAQVDVFTSHYPYVKVNIGVAEQQTSVKNHTHNPIWNEKLHFGNISDADAEKVVVALYDDYSLDSSSRELIGSAVMSILPFRNHKAQLELSVHDTEGEEEAVIELEAELRVDS